MRKRSFLLVVFKIFELEYLLKKPQDTTFTFSRVKDSVQNDRYH